MQSQSQLMDFFSSFSQVYVLNRCAFVFYDIDCSFRHWFYMTKIQIFCDWNIAVDDNDCEWFFSFKLALISGTRQWSDLFLRVTGEKFPANFRWFAQIGETNPLFFILFSINNLSWYSIGYELEQKIFAQPRKKKFLILLCCCFFSSVTALVINRGVRCL